MIGQDVRSFEQRYHKEEADQDRVYSNKASFKVSLKSRREFVGTRIFNNKAGQQKKNDYRLLPEAKYMRLRYVS